VGQNAAVERMYEFLGYCSFSISDYSPASAKLSSTKFAIVLLVESRNYVGSTVWPVYRKLFNGKQHQNHIEKPSQYKMYTFSTGRLKGQDRAKKGHFQVQIAFHIIINWFNIYT
jgi:hypothetical protein